MAKKKSLWSVLTKIDKPKKETSKKPKNKELTKKSLVEEKAINQLMIYVKKALNSGFSKNQICKELTSKKWPQKDIKLVFKEIENQKQKKQVVPKIIQNPKKKKLIKKSEEILPKKVKKKTSKKSKKKKANVKKKHKKKN